VKSFINIGSGLNPVAQRNFLLNIFDGAIFTFGMSFVSIVTILPVYVKQIGGSNIEIGLLPVIWALGFNLPQIMIANYTSNQPFKKNIILFTALFQRLAWLILAFLSILINYFVNQSLGLVLFFICFALAAITGGINLPVWFDLLAKLTPVNVRGKQFAFRSMLGAIFGIIAGWLTIVIFNNIESPASFTILFFVAFIIMMISYYFLMQLVEETPNPTKRKLNTTQFFKKLPKLLKEKKNYRHFLIADALLVVAMISNAFITIYALSKFSLADSYIGTFTIASMLSLIFGSFFFGKISDKLGHRLNILLAAIFSALSCFTAIISPTIIVYYLVFVTSALTIGIIQVSRLPLIAELCRENDIPTYVALSNVVTIPFVISGIFAGWLANVAGYEIVFMISGTAAIMSIFWIIFKVDEPRRLIN